jgi:thioredoxin
LAAFRFLFFLFFCVWGFAGHVAFSTGVTPAPDLPLLSGDQFKDKVDQSKIPVVLDFWATWCAPCKVYSPVIVETSKSYVGKMAFYKVDVSDFSNDKTVQNYSIQSLPTVLVIVKGQVVERWEGILKTKDLKSKLNQVLKTWGKPSGSKQ